jgi:D-serine deaminase-like pyridoxal phosphate-dependent protein
MSRPGAAVQWHPRAQCQPGERERPVITEGVLLQFGDLVAQRGGTVQDRWAVYQQTG